MSDKQSHKGEKNGRAKLTELDVLHIRDLYDPYWTTQKHLAMIFGVSYGCIKDIIQKKTWKNI